MIGEWARVRTEPAIQVAVVRERNEANTLKFNLICFFIANKCRDCSGGEREREPRRQDGEEGSMRENVIGSQKSAVMFWSLRRNNRVGMVITANQTCT